MHLSRALVTGLAGATAMGATTALDMRLRGRSASAVPAQVLSKIPGLGDLAQRHSSLISWAALPVTAVAAGALRERLRFRAAPAAFLALVWVPDLVLPTAAADYPPPWRWPTVELAISAGHHAAFAGAAEAAYRLVGSS
jgi:hypothetical protein